MHLQNVISKSGIYMYFYLLFCYFCKKYENETKNKNVKVLIYILVFYELD